MITFTTWEDYGASKTRHVTAREIVSITERTNRQAYGFNQPTAVITLRGGESFEVLDYARNLKEKVLSAQDNEAQAEHVAMHHPSCERKEGCCA